VNEVPVPKLEPPELAEYQFNVPALAVAPSITVPVPKRLPGVVPVIVGVVFTETTVVPTALVHPFVVIVKLYVPAIAVVAPVLVGFCAEDENEEGPVQLYVAPATAEVDKLIVFVAQTGELLEAVGIPGVELTTTAVIPAPLVQPFVVTITLYVPAIAVVAFVLAGF
jgi:hypothetical protein